MKKTITPATTIPTTAVTDSPTRLGGVGEAGPCDDELLGDEGAACTGAPAVSVAVVGGTETRCSSLPAGRAGLIGFDTDGGISRA
jgi:hypothetical protein